MLLKSLSLTALLALALAIAASAHAEIRHAQAYESLTAVPLKPGQAPRFVNGLSDLSGSEKRHPERLPVQLDGAVKKIQKKKYRPSGLSRDNPAEF